MLDGVNHSIARNSFEKHDLVGWATWGGEVDILLSSGAEQLCYG
jgi:hypothetical protein